jgi:RhtB (resistance to homoserine/threonine) family protein
MFDPLYWLAFFSAAVALTVSPGPDILYVLSRTVAQGKKIGLASVAGVGAGALIHACAAAVGLSAILATSAAAFTVVKLLGAGYLIYLGIKALRSSGAMAQPIERTLPRVTAWQAFRQGVLIDVLNPKVAIFFMAFLPQFLRPQLGNEGLQLAGLGVLVVVVGIVTDTCFVLAAAKATAFFRDSPRASVWLNRMLGTVLVALGLRLALVEQRN